MLIFRLQISNIKNKGKRLSIFQEINNFLVKLFINWQIRVTRIIDFRSARKFKICHQLKS